MKDKNYKIIKEIKGKEAINGKKRYYINGFNNTRKNYKC